MNLSKKQFFAGVRWALWIAFMVGIAIQLMYVPADFAVASVSPHWPEMRDLLSSGTLMCFVWLVLCAYWGVLKNGYSSQGIFGLSWSILLVGAALSLLVFVRWNWEAVFALIYTKELGPSILARTVTAQQAVYLAIFTLLMMLPSVLVGFLSALEIDETGFYHDLIIMVLGIGMATVLIMVFWRTLTWPLNGIVQAHILPDFGQASGIFQMVLAANTLRAFFLVFKIEQAEPRMAVSPPPSLNS